MRFELLCPACGVRDFDFDDYESLVLLAPNLALVQFKCPCCGIHLSATLKLSAKMRHRVRQMIDEAEAAGVRDAEVRPFSTLSDSSVLSYSSSLIIDEDETDIEFIRPLRVGNADVRAHLEYFKRQLETIETVDEAIEEIDAGYYRERRDA
jgi:predicted RNA-binding Zn-ribbon protein involved in translation (DUF1610 family)